ncbi:MAG: AMP-binding protein, partial [Phycisphaerales bacterium]|nr:AMP-binding protein [Phycisphaerales bacterium]
MYPGFHAQEFPDKPAVINAATEETVTYKELNARSNQLAQYLHAEGLRRGDHVALFIENDVRFFECLWAAMRSGLYITAINRYLTDDEAAYIINDCEAKALITSFRRADVAKDLPPLTPNCSIRLMMRGTIDGYASYEDTIAAHSADNIAEEWRGDMMLYSSGTTGRPKGVKRPLMDCKVYEDDRLREALSTVYEFGDDTIYLSPAPL